MHLYQTEGGIEAKGLWYGFQSAAGNGPQDGSTWWRISYICFEYHRLIPEWICFCPKELNRKKEIILVLRFFSFTEAGFFQALSKNLKGFLRNDNDQNMYTEMNSSWKNEIKRRIQAFLTFEAKSFGEMINIFYAGMTYLYPNVEIICIIKCLYANLKAEIYYLFYV